MVLLALVWGYCSTECCTRRNTITLYTVAYRRDLLAGAANTAPPDGPLHKCVQVCLNGVKFGKRPSLMTYVRGVRSVRAPAQHHQGTKCKLKQPDRGNNRQAATAGPSPHMDPTTMRAPPPWQHHAGANASHQAPPNRQRPTIRATAPEANLLRTIATSKCDKALAHTHSRPPLAKPK